MAQSVEGAHVIKLGRGILLVVALMLAACAQPQSPGGQTSAPGEAARPAARKVVTAAVFSQVPFAAPALIPADASGNEVVVALANSGFTVVNRQAALEPRLAETIPSVDNGLWKVLPDGRMEMTWKLRKGVQWHDRVPFTSADAVFTATVYRDKETLQFYSATYASLESVEAPDPLTLVVRFSKPYIDGDKLFTWLIPEHLAGKPYREDKANFTTLALWREEFVGTGPFRIKEWDPGSQVTFEAFDNYLLARPKIDELVVKFIPDSNTLLANLLAGTVQMNLGRGLSLEQALQLEQQWKDGRVDTSSGNVVHIWPQFKYANPAIITDVRFRRAMLYAIDRQEMVDTLEAGKSTIGNAWIKPDDADYPLVEKSIVRYEFDPRRAVQMVEELGYTRGADGIFRDASGRNLSVELRTTGSNDIQPKTMHSVADYWQRIGVDVQQNEVPRQLAQDLEYRTKYPGFEELRGPTTPNVTTTPELKTAENKYAGGNYPSYSNPQYDAVADKYYSTIPKPERMQVAAEIMHWWSDQLIDMPLFYDIEPIAINNHLVGPAARNASGNHAWNAHEWDLKGS